MIGPFDKACPRCSKAGAASVAVPRDDDAASGIVATSRLIDGAVEFSSGDGCSHPAGDVADALESELSHVQNADASSHGNGHESSGTMTAVAPRKRKRRRSRLLMGDQVNEHDAKSMPRIRIAAEHHEIREMLIAPDPDPSYFAMGHDIVEEAVDGDYSDASLDEVREELKEDIEYFEEYKVELQVKAEKNLKSQKVLDRLLAAVGVVVVIMLLVAGDWAIIGVKLNAAVFKDPKGGVDIINEDTFPWYNVTASTSLMKFIYTSPRYKKIAPGETVTLHNSDLKSADGTRAPAAAVLDGLDIACVSVPGQGTWSGAIEKDHHWKAGEPGGPTRPRVLPVPARPASAAAGASKTTAPAASSPSASQNSYGGS